MIAPADFFASFSFVQVTPAFTDRIAFSPSRRRYSFSEHVVTEAASPARETVSKEFSTRVAEGMTRLSEGQREILTLRDTLDRSYEEISRQLGIDLGTVKSRIARARETLFGLLTKACPEFGAHPKPKARFETPRPTGGVDFFCA